MKAPDLSKVFPKRQPAVMAPNSLPRSALPRLPGPQQAIDGVPDALKAPRRGWTNQAPYDSMPRSVRTELAAFESAAHAREHATGPGWVWLQFTMPGNSLSMMSLIALAVSRGR